jgi:hypothetical protein
MVQLECLSAGLGQWLVFIASLAPVGLNLLWVFWVRGEYARRCTLVLGVPARHNISTVSDGLRAALRNAGLGMLCGMRQGHIAGCLSCIELCCGAKAISTAS